MDDHLDDRLEREAAASGTSKAALIRACVAARYAGHAVDTDPLTALVGRFDGDPVDDIDAVIYD
jgi:Ribbon-helix-helix protein, copG family